MPDINISPYVLPPVMSLLTAYSLAIVAIIKGGTKKENVLLAVLCVWWTLLSWAFISHHFIEDQESLLKIERFIHFFYVYNPSLTMLFFQTITGQKKLPIIISGFILSFILSLLVFTDYYFYSFFEYRWGLIAKTGIAFKIFSLYAFIATIYIFSLFIKKYKTEKNPVTRLKLNYFFISFFILLVLTMSNIPAMHGMDFYPLSNFMFIPLGILTYGILRYRLIEISSVLHITAIWMILSSFIAIPNFVILLLLKPLFYILHPFFLFIILLIWFQSNYLYFNKIQPLINEFFNRRSYKLSKIEKNFFDDMSFLRGLDDLIKEVMLVLKKSLGISRVNIFFRKDYSGSFVDLKNNPLEIDPILVELIKGQDHYVEKYFIEFNSDLSYLKKKFMHLFESQNSEYLMPLSYNNHLIAILFLSGKTSGKRFKEREFMFINRIGRFAAIALSNSIMYQNLFDIKDNLEKIVEERTAVIENQKGELKKDIELAKTIQAALLPQKIPSLKQVDIAYRYVPMMAVGGDFIDVHYREGMKETGLFICDVSGHGVASALIASMVKMSLSSWGKYILNPGGTFKEIKRQLHDKIGSNFISACICTINIETGRIISANAGHPPMFILRKNGEVESVQPKGKIIISFADSEYEEAQGQLYPGDKVIMYTDGVFECRNSKGRMIELEGLIDIIKRNQHLAPRLLCDKIYDEIFSTIGCSNNIEDDFAIIIAEYKGSA